MFKLFDNIKRHTYVFCKMSVCNINMKLIKTISIDTQVQDEGYISTLNLIGVGRTATAQAILGTGYVREIFLNNDGYNYSSPPIITFSPSPAGDDARGVGILTTVGNITSLKEILMTNAGAGYTVEPTITISGGGGTGAAATWSVETVYDGVIRFTLIDGGVGYSIWERRY